MKKNASNKVPNTNNGKFRARKPKQEEFASGFLKIHFVCDWFIGTLFCRFLLNVKAQKLMQIARIQLEYYRSSFL